MPSLHLPRIRPYPMMRRKIRRMIGLRGYWCIPKEDEAAFIAAVQRGIADADAGRVIDHDVFMAELDADLSEEFAPCYRRHRCCCARPGRRA